ncbi:hypothetical protein Clacol_010094 [Clathrus columnatus]|uniref:Importin N-terminal domain-containing protein n=1 Tax=Clathrus columnatus TaxID=1419009 RepID=A0AAV5AU41_9AGAM|nr:hypothetical protein Clacol_010094 [Clathrus columnatus]
MCVAFWTLDHPDYALDEYFDRPTKTAHWHNFDQPLSKPTVLSGIDIVAGGTWLGINETGNIAVLTNITEPHSNMSSSRGHLCSSFLLHPRYGSEVNLSQYAKELTTAETPYSGFNLLLLSSSAKSDESSQLQYDFKILSNNGAGGTIEVVKPSSDNSNSCFGMSNGSPNGEDPFTSERKNTEWAKVSQGRQLLHDISAQHQDEAQLVEALFSLLRIKQGQVPASRADFQRNIIIDAVNLAEMRRGASFQRTEREDTIKEFAKESTQASRYYATRLATVILVRRSGEVVFVERDVWFMDNSEPKLREIGDNRTTLSPDPNVRKAAELDIRRVARQEGMLTAMMQIIGNEGVDVATRLACAIYLKNRLRRTYYLDPTSQATGEQNPILPSDRAALKANIIPLLIATASSKQINAQLSNSIRSIISVDFPNDWPTLLGDAKRLLNSSNLTEVETGLIVLLEIVKAFRQVDRLTPQIIEETFPMIVAIGLQLLDSPPAPLTPQSPEIPRLLHFILKIYKSTLVTNLSTHQQSGASIVPWGQVFFRVINLQIPPEALPQDEEERERCEWWKAKKWAYSSLDRLFHRFGNPSQLPSALKEYMPFAEHFITTFAPEMISTYLRQLDLYTSGQVWMSKKCQYLIFQFLTECVKPKSTWALLKDHFERLVSACVFPQLCFNDSRKETWESDAVDFVRTASDEYEDYNSPVSSSCNFLMSLARNRTKTAFLPTLTFINNVLRGNAPPEQRYGALSMAALLAPCMVRHPTVKHALEPFFTNHVLREFSAPEGYMRYIACRVLGNISKYEMEWSNENVLSQHYHAVMKMLDDPCLPTRIAAADALGILVDKQPSIEAAVKPVVGKVVQDVLRLSDETDLEVLNNVMETMVKHYAVDLLPVATQLTERLCQLYQRLVKDTLTTQPDEDDDISPEQVDFGDDKTYAAMGMCKTIQTIISSLDSSPDILSQLQDIVAPIIIYTLENLAIDLLTNVYDLVDSLTFSVRRIPPTMWPIFELTYKLFQVDAQDFLEEMLPSIDNFISFGKDVFIQRADYRAMAVDIYRISMTSEHLGEADRVNGSKVAESLLLNLRGYLDDALPTFISAALQCIDSKPSTRYLRINNLNVLVNCILYNPGLTLRILESQNGTQKFFENWFKTINSETGMPRVHAKKLTILAICALFETEPSALPRSIQEGWGSIMAGILKTLREMPGALEARKALFDRHAKEDEAEGEDFADDLNLEGDEDADVWDADSEYLEFLAKEGQRLKERESGAQDGYEEEDEEEDEEEGDEEWADDELGYISPIDNVDVYLSFKNALEVFQMKNAAGYATATSSLNIEMQTVMMEAMARAQAAAI